jgi:hypothetical protein
MGNFLYLRRSSLFNLCVVIVFSISTSSAFACTTDAWLGGAVGAITPDDPLNGVARVKGTCGLEVTGPGHVMDGSPFEDANFIGHFYFFPQFTGSGTTDLFVAYSNEAGTTELFSVRYDGTNVIFDATGGAGGTSVSFPADPTHWNLVEFTWSSGNSGSLWVNSDATSDPADQTFTSGTGMVESVKLGAPNGFGGFGGKVSFDEYEAHRVQQVGMLLAGDADLDDLINSSDINAIVDEFLFDVLAEGVIDCNLDGLVDSGDINCVVDIFLGNP